MSTSFSKRRWETTSTPRPLMPTHTYSHERIDHLQYIPAIPKYVRICCVVLPQASSIRIVGWRKMASKSNLIVRLGWILNLMLPFMIVRFICSMWSRVAISFYKPHSMECVAGGLSDCQSHLFLDLINILRDSWLHQDHGCLSLFMWSLMSLGFRIEHFTSCLLERLLPN